MSTTKHCVVTKSTITLSVYMDMILPAIPITLSSHIHTLTQNNKHTNVYSFLSPPRRRMDYLLDEDVEIELSAMAFEDDFVTQQKNEQHVDDTTTIPDSLPPSTEAATSSIKAANLTGCSFSQ